MTEWTAKQVRAYFLGVIDKNLTQKELAKTIGVSEASISRFINGEIGPGEKALDFLGLERIFKYRPTQNPLPHDPYFRGVIPQNKLGTGGTKKLIDRPDGFY